MGQAEMSNSEKSIQHKSSTQSEEPFRKGERKGYKPTREGYQPSVPLGYTATREGAASGDGNASKFPKAPKGDSGESSKGSGESSSG